MIETAFDVPFIADLALHEKQIQQNYRPVIAIHKWFARRPGTLFRGLLLSEFSQGKLKDNFFESHNLKGITVLDPFMGGGTPLLEANRVGCDIIGYDINPMAYWIVREAIESLDIEDYVRCAAALRAELEGKVGKFYRTKCLECGSTEASVKYFIWVKTHSCIRCAQRFDLFPGYLLSEDRRHPANVLICSVCGELNEVEDPRKAGLCHACGAALRYSGPASRNRCSCPNCGTVNTYASPEGGPPDHRMVAIEYFCPRCRSAHKGRFFKKPDEEDRRRYEEASIQFSAMQTRYVPDDEIPSGDETDRLHRWGYSRYRQMFNQRQLLGIELSCRAIANQANERIRNALATNLSDLLRYQNMLCRYDAMALKSLDIFSVHGFPVSLMQCESNLLGIIDRNSYKNIGSGGWSNIIDKYTRAKKYCKNVFEIKHENNKKIYLRLRDEWVGETREVKGRTEKRRVELRCESSTSMQLEPESVDVVLTDPPYFTNVQYAELMDFCYAWLRRLVANPNLRKKSTRDENELTGNTTMEKGILHFTEGLSSVFLRAAGALKPGRPFVFTYHHNTIGAYLPVAVAILDSGLKCSASIPCPAEMGASIHINGTGSSIIDTIFVCRSKGTISRRSLAFTSEGIAELVKTDMLNLLSGNLRVTRGDVRCIAYGHLIRMAMWVLKDTWDSTMPTQQKLDGVSDTVKKLGDWPMIEQCLEDSVGPVQRQQRWAVTDNQTGYEVLGDEVSF